MYIIIRPALKHKILEIVFF